MTDNIQPSAEVPQPEVLPSMIEEAPVAVEETPSAPLDTSEQAPAQPQEGSEEWFAQDRAEFVKAYPDVDRQALFSTEEFVDFAEGKVGNMPMTEIYRKYLKWRAKPSPRELARLSSPGALGRAQPQGEGEFFTLNEIRKMSSADINKHWDKVQASLKHISR